MTNMTVTQAEAHLAAHGSLVGVRVEMDRPFSPSGDIEMRDCIVVATPEYQKVLDQQARDSAAWRRGEEMGWEEFKAYMNRWRDEVDA